MQVQYVSGCSTTCGHVFVSMRLCVFWSIFPRLCLSLSVPVFLHMFVCVVESVCVRVCSCLCHRHMLPVGTGCKAKPSWKHWAFGWTSSTCHQHRFAFIFFSLSHSQPTSEHSAIKLRLSQSLPLSKLNSRKDSYSVVCVNNVAGRGFSMPRPGKYPN